MQIEEAIEYLKMRSEKYKANKELMGLAEDIYGAEAVKEYDKKQEAIETVLNYIETMHKEFDRLEGIEDNTSMLKYELEKKDKVIDEMANSLIGIGLYDIKVGQKFCFNEEEVKEYFYKKASDNK